MRGGRWSCGASEEHACARGTVGRRAARRARLCAGTSVADRRQGAEGADYHASKVSAQGACRPGSPAWVPGGAGAGGAAPRKMKMSHPGTPCRRRPGGPAQPSRARPCGPLAAASNGRARDKACPRAAPLPPDGRARDKACPFGRRTGPRSPRIRVPLGPIAYMNAQASCFRWVRPAIKRGCQMRRASAWATLGSGRPLSVRRRSTQASMAPSSLRTMSGWVGARLACSPGSLGRWNSSIGGSP